LPAAGLPDRGDLRPTAPDRRGAVCYNMRNHEVRDGSILVRRASAKMRVSALVLLAAVTAAGCGSDSKKQQSTTIANPNVLPPNYRLEIASLLASNWKDAADFYGAFISPPVLKPVGDSQHYIVCVQLNGHNQRKTKVAIYLSGNITQFIDAPGDLCSDVAYQPFNELQAMAPSGPTPAASTLPEYGIRPH
jgi:hypothetical protein